jgi:hypothetical protein
MDTLQQKLVTSPEKQLAIVFLLTITHLKLLYHEEKARRTLSVSSLAEKGLVRKSLAPTNIDPH